MKLAVVSFVVLVFVLTTKHVTGKYGKQATTAIDCMEPAVEGQKTELKCRISGTVQLGIFWVGPYNKERVACNYLQRICEPSGEFPRGYTGVIDSPQQNTLIIESFDAKTDAGTWSCYDGWGGPRSYCSKLSESQYGQQQQQQQKSVVFTPTIDIMLLREVNVNIPFSDPVK
ncbi:uncharacterized protein LOC121387571 [Gigantopelta aegis]|uniref:uncharacterized protein LOC121387571 n=1 Tax=Gigantopelta aegis TaxID=1735272 RepID=UPI001B88E2AF|nr:uncharacterized protein LOC121387571 [Gigantopelta aegis]